MILLDGVKIKKKLLATYKRRKKILDNLNAQLRQYQEKDFGLYQKFLAQRFGAEQTQERELENKIRLIKDRIQLISLLSQFRGMSAGKYCYLMKKQVTPETDFWTLLNNELLEIEEMQRKKEEERWKKFEEKARNTRESKNKHNKKSDDGDDWDEESIIQDIEDDIINMFNAIYSGLGGKPFTQEENDEYFHELKKLYRELCLRYHPDRIGQHDTKMQQLWNSIQSAYQENDLDSLRCIYLGTEMESNHAIPTCSELDLLIGKVNESIYHIRSDVSSKKKVPFWGFSTWDETQINHALIEIAAEYKRLIRSASENLAECEKRLEKLLNYSPTPKQDRRRRVADGWEQKDLFD